MGATPTREKLMRRSKGRNNGEGVVDVLRVMGELEGDRVQRHVRKAIIEGWSNGYSFGQTNLTQCKAPTLSLSPCARHSPRLSGVATNHQERDISWGTIPINLRRMYALPLPVGREPGDMPAHVIPYHRPRTSSVLHTKRPWKLSFMGEKVDLLGL
ncbi:hypothetical protein HZH68_015667 [Vespula germanica]|uniref:Uncharacterized protein n=1 Tax=Vespula germanica TaxID=30212 RepID=A0A834J7E5_VESGE|nr:hypothetical protein HZH68_015667 [Vespula germanica]